MDDARAQIAKRQLAAPPEDVLRAQVLERLILTRVQTQRAEQAGIRIDDRELNEVLTNIAKQNGMTLSAFAEAVRGDVSTIWPCASRSATRSRPSACATRKSTAAWLSPSRMSMPSSPARAPTATMNTGCRTF